MYNNIHMYLFIYLSCTCTQAVRTCFEDGDLAEISPGLQALSDLTKGHFTLPRHRRDIAKADGGDGHRADPHSLKKVTA